MVVMYHLDGLGIAQPVGFAAEFEPDVPRLHHVGYRKKDRFLIVPSVFVNDVCHGTNYRIVAESLKKAGFLDHAATRLEKMERVPDFVDNDGKEKSSTWFFVISDQILRY